MEDFPTPASPDPLSHDLETIHRNCSQESFPAQDLTSLVQIIKSDPPTLAEDTEIPVLEEHVDATVSWALIQV